MTIIVAHATVSMGLFLRTSVTKNSLALAFLGGVGY